MPLINEDQLKRLIEEMQTGQPPSKISDKKAYSFFTAPRQEDLSIDLLNQFNATIRFSQEQMIDIVLQRTRTLKHNKKKEVEQKNVPLQYQNCAKITARYNGLCDILCNYVTENDLLKDEKTFRALALDKKDNQVKLVEKLERSYYKTHVLETASIIQKLLAFIFKIYPNNLLSGKDQSKLVKSQPQQSDQPQKLSLDLDVLTKALENVEIGKYVKVCGINRTGIKLAGHSMLIKKCTNDTFALYDPNNGVSFNLKIGELNSKLEKYLNNDKYNEVVLMDNSKYVANLSLKKDLNVKSTFSLKS